MPLPRHQRTRPVFSETFQRDYRETIAAMDAGGHDIPRQAPATRLRLERVGVTRRAVPVRIVDPFGGGGEVTLSCRVEAALELAPDRRGIHVSRIGDLVARLSEEAHPTLQAYAAELAHALRVAQDSETASVGVEATLSYLENVRGVKTKASLEHLELSARAHLAGKRKSCASGLGFNHITACPCVQETFRHSFAKAASGKGTMPLLTHTQRCETQLLISEAAAPFDLARLLDAIDAVVVRSQNTLPREFELLNVYRAHARPQFLEDALRDLLFATYQAIGAESPQAIIRLRSRSLESIHDFDMAGEIALAVKELDRIFTSPPKESRNGTAPVQKAGRKNPGNPSKTKRSPQADSRRS